MQINLACPKEASIVCLRELERFIDNQNNVLVRMVDTDNHSPENNKRKTRCPSTNTDDLFTCITSPPTREMELIHSMGS